MVDVFFRDIKGELSNISKERQGKATTHALYSLSKPFIVPCR
jgi:hypothetical protein